MKKFSFSIFYLALLLLSACSSQSGRMGSEDDFDKLKAAKTRVSLGLTYLNNGNYSQAKFNLDKALQFAPRLADAHFSLAYYYQQVEEHDAAEKAYQRAMDLAPKNADIANSYGAFLCQRGKYQQAKRYFLKAVNSDNYISSAETYENLALCSRSQGEMSDSLEYLRSAVNHQPGRAKSLYMLAEALAETQRWAEAKDVLRRYEKVSQVSARSLLLASQIERALGNTQLSEGYGAMLLRMYPTDPATEQYLQKMKVLTIPPIARKLSKSSLEAPNTRPVRIDTEYVNERAKTDEELTAITTAALESAKKVAVKQTGIKSEPQTLPTFHIVQEDENLYRISLLYNIRMQRLVEWNNLSDSSAIYQGKKLRLVAPENKE